MNFTIKRGANLAPLFCDNIIKKFLKKWQVILIFTHIIIIFSVNFRRLIKIVFKSARKFTCVLIPKMFGYR